MPECGDDALSAGLVVHREDCQFKLEVSNDAQFSALFALNAIGTMRDECGGLLDHSKGGYERTLTGQEDAQEARSILTMASLACH